MGQQIGHVGAAEGVAQKHQGHDHHRQAEHAARGFQQQRDTDQRDPDVNRRWQAGPRGQLAVEQENISGTERTDQREHPVEDGHMVARRALAGRVGHETEKDREREVDGAAFGVVEHKNAQAERQWRGDPELEQRPSHRHEQKQPSHEWAGLATTGIVVLHQLVDIDVGGVRGICGFFCHEKTPWPTPAWDVAAPNHRTPENKPPHGRGPRMGWWPAAG